MSILVCLCVRADEENWSQVGREKLLNKLMEAELDCEGILQQVAALNDTIRWLKEVPQNSMLFSTCMLMNQR